MAFDLIDGLIAAASAALGGFLTANASESAAETQAGAAREAGAISSERFQQTRADVRPFTLAGQDSTAALHALFGLGPGQNPLTSALLSPFNMSQEGLEATPGYQFTLDQGLKGIENSRVSRGMSGNALREAARYATGLADTTYGQQYDRYLGQQSAITNKLMALSGMGLNAGVQSGQIGQMAAGQTGEAITGAGTAEAAGRVGAAGAYAGIPNNAFLNYLAMQAAQGQGMFR